MSNIMSLKKYLLLLVLVSFGMLAGTPADAWKASDEAQRRDFMDKEMDCINRQLGAGGDVTWTGTCSSRYSGTFDVARASQTDSYDATPVFSDAAYSNWDAPADSPQRYSESQKQAAPDWDDKYDDTGYAGSSHDPSDGWADPSLTTVDIGGELSHLRYVEPDLMRSKGYLWGVFGVFTFRTSENKHIKSAGDIFSDENAINMFRLDAKFSGGNLDYDSAGTGSSEDDRHYMLETRGSIGYDIPVGSMWRITPYGGFGYRWFKDDSGGTTTTTGAYAYDRESRYYYIPLGVEAQARLDHDWLLEATFEYDYFLCGTQKSHFEDVDSGYNTLYNRQDSGYGVRGSLKIIKQHKGFNIFVEPFVRYWNIDDSDTAILTYYETPVSLGIEPANTTTEYGVKTGLRF